MEWTPVTRRRSGGRGGGSGRGSGRGGAASAEAALQQFIALAQAMRPAGAPTTPPPRPQGSGARGGGKGGARQVGPKWGCRCGFADNFPGRDTCFRCGLAKRGAPGPRPPSAAGPRARSATPASRPPGAPAPPVPPPSPPSQDGPEIGPVPPAERLRQVASLKAGLRGRPGGEAILAALVEEEGVLRASLAAGRPLEERARARADQAAQAGRAAALARMTTALDEVVVDGILTNIPLHRDLVRDAAFAAGGTDIHYLERRLALD